MTYNVGDLVFAPKKYDYDSPHYEWWPIKTNDEYAIITKVVRITNTRLKYYIKFIDGSEDFVSACEFKLMASCVKISRDFAAAPPDRIWKDL